MKRLPLLLSVMLFCLILVVQSHSQEQPVIRFSSEGVREAIGFEVMFKVPVALLGKGVRYAKISEMNPQFNNVINYFKELEKKYGEMKLFKQIPDDVWGETQRIRPKDGKLIHVRDLSQLYFIKFNNYIPVDEIVGELESMPEVEFAHQPVQAMSLIEPNDLEYNGVDLWNLINIDAPKALDITKGSTSISIGIIEVFSAPNFSHEDLVGKRDGTKGETSTGSNHATRVASVAGAATNNGKGIASLGWNLKLAGYSFSPGTGEGTGVGSLPAKINEAVNDGMRVINCSFTTFELVIEGNCKLLVPKSYPSVQESISRAVSDFDVVVVASAGNSVTSIIDDGSCEPEDVPEEYFPNFPFPAKYDTVIAVSAVGENDLFGEGSTYPYNTGHFIDVAAPGMNVVTAYGSSSYNEASGTSFSAPHVAALAGLILSVNSSLSNVDVEKIIATTAEKVGSKSYSTTKTYGTWNNEMGYGRINAYDALKYTLENYGGTLSNDLVIDTG